MAGGDPQHRPIGDLRVQLTLLMFPVLMVMYMRLARREEAEMAVEFGNEYAIYLAGTPRFLPRRPVAAEQRSKA